MRNIFLTDLRIIRFSGGTLLHGIMEAKPNEDKSIKSRFEYEIRMFRDLNEPFSFHSDRNNSSSHSQNTHIFSLTQGVDFLR
jgi:hypothetical protein